MSSNPNEQQSPPLIRPASPSSNSNSSVHPQQPQVQQAKQVQVEAKTGSNDLKGTELVASTNSKAKTTTKKIKSEMDELIRDKVKLLPEGYSDMKSLQKHYEDQKNARKNRELLRWELREHTSKTIFMRYNELFL